MKLAPLLGAIFAGGAKAAVSATGVSLILGATYLADCRINGGGGEAMDRCYLTAAALAGVGTGAGVGYAAGYNTYNPTLRRPEDGPTGLDRDEHGRFRRRQP